MRRIVYREPTPENWQKVLDNESLLNRFVSKIAVEQDVLTFAELKSLGWEGMLQAVQNWDPKRGRFSTLAWYCVKDATALGIREELAQRGQALKRGSRMLPTEMFISVQLDDADKELFESEFEGEVDEYEDLYTAIEQLEPFEREVLVLHYFGTKEHPRGYSTREIGKLLGYSSPWVSIVLRGTARKLGESLTAEEGAA